jgi:endonuclease YncB( thermonuclease family)
MNRTFSRCGLLRIAAMFLIIQGSLMARETKDWWRVYYNVRFLQEEYRDGDSFSLKVKSGSRELTWKIRVYGSDTPESEAATPSPELLANQAKTFGLASENDVLTWGGKASAATETWLSSAKQIDLFVPEDGKEKAGDGRYLGIVRITPKDGEPYLLHERLLEEGLASPSANMAPWPEKDFRRWDEEELRDRYRRDLTQKANKAKRDRTGIWGKQ